MAHLSDEALLGELGRVSRAHKVVTAELVAHIAEVDARKLYLGQASPSMFAYCVDRLGCSEDEACRRIDAARSSAKWPVILPRIASGEISLTVLSKLKPFLNEENVGELLDAAARKSVREAERILAARFPKPDTADSIRKLPEVKGAKVGPSPSLPGIATDAAAGADAIVPNSLIEADAPKLGTGAEQVRPRIREWPDDRWIADACRRCRRSGSR